jgi:polymorphic membrane protein
MKNLALIFLLILTLNATALIINIPMDYSTIQEGVNAAAENDTVLVAPGIYFENIVWPAVNSINLIGSGVFDCIIDGNAQNSVILLDVGSGIIDSTTVINGFTLRNGEAEAGGGICAYYAAPSLKELIITENTADSDGGGLFCFNYSHFKIENVTIRNNTAGSEGGGINCDFTSNIRIFNSSIVDNAANLCGGGICIEGGSHPIIHYSIIKGNSAEYGGGIWSGEKGSCQLINCTVVNNEATEQGGAYFSNYPTMDVINSIFWYNTPDQIWEDAFVTYSDIEDGWTGFGNIDMDPLFVAPEYGNYMLSENSPCIDAGDPDSPYDPDGTIADMGCCYFYQPSGADNPIPENKRKLTNYPNPFNPTTTISFTLTAKDAKGAMLEIFNLKGQRIKTYYCHPEPVEGRQSIIWSGEDDAGSPVCSGVYFIRLITDGAVSSTRKCVLMK